MTDSIINATAYAGQAVLINWSETDKGRMVTFLLDEESRVHPFKGYKRGPEHGQRFELACVCVADDDSMQSTDDAKASKKARKSTNGPDSGPPPHGQPTKTAPNGQDKARSLSQVAYLYCAAMIFNHGWAFRQRKTRPKAIFALPDCKPQRTRHQRSGGK
jgi:hypothetical protein